MVRPLRVDEMRLRLRLRLRLRRPRIATARVYTDPVRKFHVVLLGSPCSRRNDDSGDARDKACPRFHANSGSALGPPCPPACCRLPLVQG